MYSSLFHAISWNIKELLHRHQIYRKFKKLLLICLPLQLLMYSKIKMRNMRAEKYILFHNSWLWMKKCEKEIRVSVFASFGTTTDPSLSISAFWQVLWFSTFFLLPSSSGLQKWNYRQHLWYLLYDWNLSFLFPAHLMMWSWCQGGEHSQMQTFSLAN